MRITISHLVSIYNEAYFDYDYTVSDRSSPVARRSSVADFKLCLTAAHIIVLITILPLLVADRVPEDILACPVASADICDSLKQ